MEYMLKIIDLIKESKKRNQGCQLRFTKKRTAYDGPGYTLLLSNYYAWHK